MKQELNHKYRRLIEVVVLIILGVLVIVVMQFIPGGDKVLHDAGQAEHTESPRLEYGVEVDTLEVVRDVVKRNEFLADIMLRYGVDYRLIDRIARSPREVFDARRIRAGNTYSVIRTFDSVPRTLYFAYEASPSRYVLFDLRDSLHIIQGEKEIERRLSSCSGTISSSLWNAMLENDTDPGLANELSEIFAWTIDFFGIRKGDHYRVLYERLYVDSNYVGLGRVIAAAFNHAGRDHYACYFVQDSAGDYFDEEGGSLRRTFLKAPLKYRRISSGFSYSRMHPVLKYRRPHLGVDYAAPAGTPVMAVGDGLVTFAGWTGQGGYTVRIKHNGTYSTSYCHFSGFARGIKQGVYVKQGQVIGYVGSTGLSTGPHLDFRFFRNGQPIDPLKVKSPPVLPVDTAHYARYRVFCDSLINVLGNLPGQMQ